MEWYWEELGISPTTQQVTIKKAYSEKMRYYKKLEIKEAVPHATYERLAEAEANALAYADGDNRQLQSSDDANGMTQPATCHQKDTTAESESQPVVNKSTSWQETATKEQQKEEKQEETVSVKLDSSLPQPIREQSKKKWSHWGLLTLVVVLMGVVLIGWYQNEEWPIAEQEQIEQEQEQIEQEEVVEEELSDEGISALFVELEEESNKQLGYHFFRGNDGASTQLLFQARREDDTLDKKSEFNSFIRSFVQSEQQEKIKNYLLAIKKEAKLRKKYDNVSLYKFKGNSFQGQDFIAVTYVGGDEPVDELVIMLDDQGLIEEVYGQDWLDQKEILIKYASHKDDINENAMVKFITIFNQEREMSHQSLLKYFDFSQRKLSKKLME